MIARVQFSTMTRIKRRNTYGWRMAMRCRNADGNSNKLVLCTAMRYEQNKVPKTRTILSPHARRIQSLYHCRLCAWQKVPETSVTR